MKFSCPGVMETYLPPNSSLAIKASNTYLRSFSMFVLSSFVMAAGKGYLFKFLPVLTLMDKAGRPYNKNYKFIKNTY